MQPAFSAPLGVAPASSVALLPATCRVRPSLGARALPGVRVGRRAGAATLMPPPGDDGGMMATRTETRAKMFDWKKRNDPDYGALPDGEDTPLKLHHLRPAPGSQKRKKRKGRGIAAGGSRCGFGMRGQKSRSGRSVRPGFEGGQTPLYRRIPKYVGRPTGPGHKKTVYALIKPGFLNQCAEGSIVTAEGLTEMGVLTRQKRKIFKVVGGADVTVQGLTVKAHAFTTSAVEAIERANGRCVLVSPTTGKDVEVEEEAEEEVGEEVGSEAEGDESGDESSGESSEDEAA